MTNDSYREINSSQELKLVLGWCEHTLYFGKIRFEKDGSLVFVSKFHNNGQPIELGDASQFKSQNEFKINGPDRKINAKNGVHVSLHPRGQVMHFRENYPGHILDRRLVCWYPVTQPFTLLYFYTPPLDTCDESKKALTVPGAIPDSYTDSISIKIDILPKQDTYVTGPYEVWGYCPDYVVRVSFGCINQRVEPMVFYPTDDLLTLD